MIEQDPRRANQISLFEDEQAPGQLALPIPGIAQPIGPGPRPAREIAPPRTASPSSGTAAGSAVRADPFYLELEQYSQLDTLAAFASGCRRCGLRAGCRAVVFGEGNPRAKLMLVGEGPGAREDELGRPFVGRAGELLDNILKAAGFARQDVYITNVVMCRPPGNRVPEEAEMDACRPYLERKIDLVDPGVIVALGSTAARALIGPWARITAVRGRWHDYRGRKLMPTFHPAALLRDPSKKSAVWEDFKAVREAVKALPRKR